jgi:plasmid stabilization system protein ParE
MGWAFRDNLDNAFKLVLEHPQAGPEVYRGLRRVLVDHFPYVVYYSLPAGAVAIRAVLHTRRRPRYPRSA